MIGASIQLIGMWIRIGCETHWYFMMLGQICIAMAWPFLANVPAFLSAVWFPKNERMLSTMIGCIMGWLGVPLSYWLSDIICYESDCFKDYIKLYPDLYELRCLYPVDKYPFIGIIQMLRHEFV